MDCIRVFQHYCFSSLTLASQFKAGLRYCKCQPNVSFAAASQLKHSTDESQSGFSSLFILKCKTLKCIYKTRIIFFVYKMLLF